MSSSVDALRALFDLAPLVERARSVGLRRRGLTLPRQRLLLLLHEVGPLVSVDVAQRLGVSPRAVTALVDGLVGQDLARRVPHPTDRRASLVELTPAGGELARSIRAAQDDAARELLGGISAADLETAARVARLVSTRLEHRNSRLAR
jgi:DNA-binding MarR family transcriptional regulator